MKVGVSDRFCRHYKLTRNGSIEPGGPFPQTWNLDLIYNGRQQLLIVATEQTSLFSTLIGCSRSRKVQIFLDLFRERLESLFRAVRLPDEYWPDLAEWSFASRSDPRFIGSQNELMKNARL